MEIRKLISILIILLGMFSVNAQQSYKPPRILFVLDGSASMMQKIDSSQTKYDLAKNVILSIVDAASKRNPEVEFALRVNGHQFDVTKNNCKDSKLEVHYSKENYSQLQLRLDDIKPSGEPSLNFGIRQCLINELQKDSRFKQTMVILSSGDNKCSTTICDSQLNKHFDELYCKPYIVIIGTNAAHLECLGDHSIINSNEGKYFAVNATLQHCKELLTPRNKNYRVSYGEARANSQGTPVARTKPMSLTAQVLSTDSGYLKVNENLLPNTFRLIYNDGSQNYVIPLSDTQLNLLKKKELIILKRGTYTLEYSFTGTDTSMLKKRPFTIKTNMVTEIKFQ